MSILKLLTENETDKAKENVANAKIFGALAMPIIDEVIRKLEGEIYEKVELKKLHRSCCILSKDFNTEVGVITLSARFTNRNSNPSGIAVNFTPAKAVEE